MKIKHVITTLALAGMLGAGAFAGIKASGVAKEVNAADAPGVCYIKGTVDSLSMDGDWDGKVLGDWNGNDQFEIKHLYLKATDQFKFYVDAEGWGASKWYGYYQIASEGGQSNLWNTADDLTPKADGYYNFYIKQSTMYTSASTATYGMVGVIEGVKDWDNDIVAPSYGDNKAALFNQHFNEGDQFKLRTIGTWEGEQFSVGAFAGSTGVYKYFGWAGGNDNVNCYIPGTYNVYLNASKQIVFEVVSLDAKAGIFVQVQDWENTYVYSYDSETYSDEEHTNKVEALGAWPGTKLSSITTETNFNGELGGIGWISVPYGAGALSKTKIIINNNSGDESTNQLLVDGAFYDKAGSTPSADKGAAAVVVREIDFADVCALTKQQAQDLLDLYNGLADTTKKGYVQQTTWNTFTWAQVSAYLTKIAQQVQDAQVLSASTNNSNNSLVTIIIISSISIVSVLGVALTIKHRKEVR